MSALSSPATRISQVIEAQQLTDFGLTKGQIDATKSIKQASNENDINEGNRQTEQQNWVARTANSNSQVRVL